MTSSSICSRGRATKAGLVFVVVVVAGGGTRGEGGGRDFACRTHRVGDVWLVSGSGVGLEALESRSTDGLPRAADLQVGTADSGDSASGGDGNSGVHSSRSLWFLLVRSRGVDRDLGVVLEVGLLGLLRFAAFFCAPLLSLALLRFGDWVCARDKVSNTAFSTLCATANFFSFLREERRRSEKKISCSQDNAISRLAVIIFTSFFLSSFLSPFQFSSPMQDLRENSAIAHLGVFSFQEGREQEGNTTRRDRGGLVPKSS